MPRLAVSVALLLAVILSFLPRTLFAETVFLPDISGGTAQAPIPEQPQTLTDGVYVYNTSSEWATFRVSGNGTQASSASFIVDKTNTFPTQCYRGAGYFGESAPIKNGAFSFQDFSSTYLTVYASMSCQMISPTQASCKVTDYFAHARGGQIHHCGTGSAILQLQQ